jgi:hypothetical protein
MKRRKASDEVILLSFGPKARREPRLRLAIKAAADMFIARPSSAEEEAYARRRQRGDARK